MESDLLKQIQDLLENAPYPIIGIDSKGKIVNWNDQAEAIFGWQKSEILNHQITEIVVQPSPNKASGEKLKKNLLSKGSQMIELLGVQKKGSRFPIKIFIASLKIKGGFLRYIFITDLRIQQDLTEGKKGSEAESALEMRDEFLSIAAHELRAPLTTLKLQLQLAKQDLLDLGFQGRPSNKELIKIFEDCLRWVNSLTNLVNELMDISKIRAGNFTLKLEKINLSSLVKEIVAYYMPQILAAKCPSVKLDLDLNVTIYCDRHRMEQVIVNLISNIIKHAPESAIHISVGITANHKAILCVQDFGPGIAKSDQIKIFHRFEQATATAGGLGLGLYIAKGIVEAHQGMIHLESEIGKGSSFIIELPLTPFD